MENPSHHFLLVLFVGFLSWAKPVRGISYTAGVVEFSQDRLLRPGESPQNLILHNTHRYVDIIATAAEHDVNIIVFPECGLTSITIPTERELIHPYVTEIPGVGANPVHLPQASQVLKLLSSAATDNNMYIVFNLDELVHCTSDQADCPSDGHLLYNTNIALDRNGTIVAKYRKYNLFVEPEFNVTQTPDHSWFDADFGVRFGMFICFDILFKEPTHPLLSHLNISNFVYSTAWFSEIPFLTAISVQAGWALNHDVNLLASGYSNVTNMNGGSGIYAGRDGRLVATMPENSATKLLIAQLSDQRGLHDNRTEEINFTEDFNKSSNFFHDVLSNYTTVLVTPESNLLKYSSEGFTCNIAVDLNHFSEHPSYRLVAFSGKRSYALVKSVHIEVCGIIACPDSNLLSCGHKPMFDSTGTVFSKISIAASSNKQLLSFPITLTKDLLSFPSKTFQFSSQDNQERSNFELVTKQRHHSFLTFAFFRNG